MAVKAIGLLETYEFSNYGEQVAACILSQGQEMNIKNLLVKYTTDKLELSGEYLGDREFVLAHEFNRGAIEALSVILKLQKQFIALEVSQTMSPTDPAFAIY